MSGLEIRVARAADGAGMAAIYTPIVRDTAVSFEADPPDAAEMAARVSATLPALPWLVCADGDAVAGYAYAGRHRTRDAYRFAAEVSVYVHPDARERGVGRALYAALLEILAAQGLLRAYAGITLPNPASVALHERTGFTPVGVYRRVGWKLGSWHDVGWWERDLAQGTDPPREPVPFAQLRGGEALANALRGLRA